MLVSSNSSIHFPGIIQFNSFLNFRNIIHFSTTRWGGYSVGSFDSFNLSEYSGDQQVNVVKNREALCKILQLNPEKLLIPYQTHEADIAIIDENFLEATREKQQERLYGKDALITCIPDVCIAVTTADCVPVLLYSEDKQVIGAVHAGWRGTQQRILQKTIAEMVNSFDVNPKKIYAVIGPSVSPEAFEVGDEVYQAFNDSGFDMSSMSFRHPLTKKYHIDLWRLNKQQLLETNIPENQIEISGICTFQNNDKFFSARRQGIKSGRMLTGLYLLPYIS